MSSSLISGIYSMAGREPVRRELWHSNETREQMKVAHSIMSKSGIAAAAQYLKSRGWKLEAARTALLP